MKSNRKLARTTRRPETGVIPRDIPRGLEVLIKKAAVDPTFKDILFEKRAGAAGAIGLKLTAAEKAILAVVPLPHLEGIIAHTRINPKLKPVFLGYAAGAMLAALGTTVTVCEEIRNKPKNEDPQIRRLSDPNLGSMRKIRMPFIGIQPDRPETYREGAAFYVGGDAAGVETRRLEDIDYRLRRLFKYVEKEYDTLVRDEEPVPRGNILVKFTITADGKVESPEIMNNNTGFPELGVETLQLLRTWRFTPVKEGSANVVYLLRFNLAKRPSGGNIPSTGVINLIYLLNNAQEIKSPPDAEGSHEWPSDRAFDSPQFYTSGLTGIRPDRVTEQKHVSPRVNPSVSISAPGVTGLALKSPRRSADVIYGLTFNRLGEINRIYGTILKKNPGLGGGKVVVRYDIAYNGDVKDAALISDTLGSAGLTRALLDEISGWKFHPIDDGGVTVVQPFVFINSYN